MVDEIYNKVRRIFCLYSTRFAYILNLFINMRLILGDILTDIFSRSFRQSLQSFCKHENILRKFYKQFNEFRLLCILCKFHSQYLSEKWNNQEILSLNA